MSDNNQNPEVKYCVHCGANIDKSQIYCPECGKLVFKIKSDKPQPIDALTEGQPQLKAKEGISRKCSGCGSIINSPILEQCPICNTKLEKLAKSQEVSVTRDPQKSSGFVFTDKKLIPERKLLLSKDIWNLREGIGVFGNSLMIYIIVRMIILFLTGYGTGDINIVFILLNLIPEIVFGVFPLWYIYSKKHSFKKLGFYSGKKMLIVAIVLALIGTVILFEIDYLSNMFIDFIYNSGFTFGIPDLFDLFAAQNQVIRDSGLLWIIILFIILNLITFSTEIIFRGVLHNTLRNHFGNNFTGRTTIIIIVALVYSGLHLLFEFPLSIFFFLLYFLNSILLGIIYELSNNIYTTILSGIFYNILFITLIVFF